MDNTDRLLRRLAIAPVPAALAETEQAIFLRIARPRSELLSGTAVFGATLLALLAGVAGGMLPDRPSRNSASLSPLVGVTTLAPSSLLESKE